MKILFIIDGLRKGGMQRRFCEVIKGLKEREIDCEIIILNPIIEYPYIYEFNYKIHILERVLKKDPRIFYKIYKIVNRFNPQIIHSWGTMSPMYLLPTVFIKKIPYVNSMIFDSKRLLFSKIDFRARLAFPFSDIILANSNAGLKAYKANRSKTKVIYNGFDFKRIENLKDKKEIRKELGVNTEFVVGMVGSFNNYKDYHTYIDSAIKMCLKNDKLTFISVGDGPNLAYLKSIVPDSVKDRILFPGMLMDIESVVNICNICVLSTFGEGISNSILEYMALSKPVIATNLGGTPETIVDQVTGFLIPASSPEILITKIQFILDNPEEGLKMGIEGNKRVHEIFSFENMIKSTLDVYTNLLNKKAKN